MVEGLLVGALVAFPVVMVLLTWGDRMKASRFTLWVALFAPLLLTEQTLAAELAQPAVSPLQALRAVIPAAGIVLAAVIARPVTGPPRWPVWWLAGFVAWCLMTSLWSVSPTASALKAVVLGFQFGALAMLVRRYPTAEAAITALVTVVYGLLFSVVVGVALFPGQALQASGAAGVPRLWGALVPLHPNTLGFVAAVGVIAVLAKQGPLWATRGAGRAVVFVLSVAVLAGTRTRYAIFIAAAVGVYVLLRRARGSVAPAIALVSAVTAVVASAVAFTASVAGLVTRGQTAEQFSSLTGRTELWSIAFRLIEERPWGGWGYYSGHRIQIAALPGSTGAELSNLDNTWIECLVDVGWIGTAMLAVFVLGSARFAGQTPPASEPAGLFLRGALVAGLIASMVNPSLQTVGYIAILLGFLLLVGPVFGSGRVESPARHVHRAPVNA